MTMRGDLKVSATLASHPNPILPSSFHFPPPKAESVLSPSYRIYSQKQSSKVENTLTTVRRDHMPLSDLADLMRSHKLVGTVMVGSSFFQLLKVKFSGSTSGGAGGPDLKPRGAGIALASIHGLSRRSSGRTTGDYQLSTNSIGQDMDSFLLNAINMNFFERLNLAWRIIFPSQMTRKSSNARLAKQRLKMILFSDRCAVTDEAKQKIVANIVHALSDFVEIESQDKVQLTVATDEDLGTIYSVTVPVRRVKPAYQDSDEVGAIANVEYKDTGERSGTVDVRFDFFIPDENAP